MGFATITLLSRLRGCESRRYRSDMNTRQLDARLEEINLRWLSLARDGDLHGAWSASDEALEARRGIDCSGWPRHQQFIWRGEDLTGKRVLVRCYHGLGDTIQFARFIPRLRAIAAEVLLWAQPRLLPLLGSLRSGAHQLLPLHDGAPEADYDIDIELFELMHALRLTLHDVAVPVPYLLPSGARRVRQAGLPRVGLVWRAGEWDDSRSIPVGSFALLNEVKHVQWVLLQRGPGLARWPHDFGSAPFMADVVEEAQEMRRLDLLISVDTCSAHLAGAIGVPVWTLLPHAADWRWMSERSDTPWYPTMRLLRQPAPGDWTALLSQIVVELGNWK
jgi:hypothetical protein